MIKNGYAILSGDQESPLRGGDIKQRLEVTQTQVHGASSCWLPRTDGAHLFLTPCLVTLP